MRVLIIEDDDLLARVIAQTLPMYMRGVSVSVRIAGDLGQAERTLQTWQPHAVILDLRLPGGDDPRTVVEFVRARTAAPIIIYTGAPPDDWGEIQSLRRVTLVVKGAAAPAHSLAPVLFALQQDAAREAAEDAAALSRGRSRLGATFAAAVRAAWLWLLRRIGK